MSKRWWRDRAVKQEKEIISPRALVFFLRLPSLEKAFEMLPATITQPTTKWLQIMVLMGDPLLLGKVKGTLGHYKFYWVISPYQAPLSLWDKNVLYWDLSFVLDEEYKHHNKAKCKTNAKAAHPKHSDYRKCWYWKTLSCLNNEKKCQ